MNHEEQTALDAVMSYLNNYAAKNVQGCVSGLAMTKQIVFLGINQGEDFRSPFDVQKSLEYDFSVMSEIRWGEPTAVHVEAAPAVASVLIELPLSYKNNGALFETMYRFAMTLTKERDKWTIRSGMVCIPFAPHTFPYKG